MKLDHIIIAVNDLTTASDNYRALGFTVTPGGVHANRATHNTLVIFANGVYLELLAATGEAPLPGLVDFSVLLQHGEGVVGYAQKSSDIAADIAYLRGEGFVMSDVIPGERRRPDGTLIQWKLALINDGFAPFLIQDVTPRDWRVPMDPALTTHPNGARGAKLAPQDHIYLVGEQVDMTRFAPDRTHGVHFAVYSE